jgi:hypothetical protein
MWFAEQLNSFLNLGICKEYPNMARSKSIAGSKANRTDAGQYEDKDKNKDKNKNKEQVGVSNPASIPDVKAVAAETAPNETEPEAKIKLEPRRLEVMKNEPRKNVVPINLEDEIRRRAYELYLQRGNSPGSEAGDWLAAEDEIRQRYHQKSA